MGNGSNEQMEDKPIRMAICYDFDKTLSPDDMQTFTIIPSLGMQKEAFWALSDKLAHENSMDGNLAWMYELLARSKVERQPIRKEYFREVGKHVPLFDGVREFGLDAAGRRLEDIEAALAQFVRDQLGEIARGLAELRAAVIIEFDVEWKKADFHGWLLLIIACVGLTDGADAVATSRQGL